MNNSDKLDRVAGCGVRSSGRSAVVCFNEQRGLFDASAAAAATHAGGAVDDCIAFACGQCLHDIRCAKCTVTG